MKLVGLILLSLIAAFCLACAQPVAGSGKVEVEIMDGASSNREMTKAELGKVAKHLDKAKTSRSVPTKTDYEESVTMLLDTRKFTCAIDGRWMIDHSGADEEHKCIRYEGPALWSVDKKSGELTFVD